MRVFATIIVLVLVLVGCEANPKITDITEPNLTVSINAKAVYSTGGFTVTQTGCSNGQTPQVPGVPNWPPSSVNGVLVVLDDDLPGPTYPFDLSVMASDPSGIKEVGARIPKGFVITNASTMSISSTHDRVYNFHTPPLLTTRTMELEYSPAPTTQSQGFAAFAYDANGNEHLLLMYIVPENEACN